MWQKFTLNANAVTSLKCIRLKLGEIGHSGTTTISLIQAIKLKTMGFIASLCLPLLFPKRFFPERMDKSWSAEEGRTQPRTAHTKWTYIKSREILREECILLVLNKYNYHRCWLSSRNYTNTQKANYTLRPWQTCIWNKGMSSIYECSSWVREKIAEQIALSNYHERTLWEERLEIRMSGT